MSDPIADLRKGVSVADILWVIMNFLQVLPRDRCGDEIDNIFAQVEALRAKMEQR